MTRRQFTVSLGGAPLAAPAAPAAGALPWSGPAVVRRVYIAVGRNITWPRHDVDVEKSRAEVDAALLQIERQHGGAVRLAGGEMLRSPEQVAAYATELRGADGLIVIPLTSQTDGWAARLAQPGVPTLFYLRPFAGHAGGAFAQLPQKGMKADILASSDPSDLDLYMNVFRTVHHLRTSKVIVVAGEMNKQETDAFSAQFGTGFVHRTYKDLAGFYRGVDPAEARRAAAAYSQAALRVVEPTAEDVTGALRMYLGIKQMMAAEQANVITMDCLGGLKRGDLEALPCAAWSLLDDQGLYGVCQADLPCVMTQLLLTGFSGKPGFVANPVIDTSRGEVIYSHCVAPTKMQGVNGTASPYVVRSHADTNRSVSIQVMMPIGEALTIGKFADARTFLYGSGQAVANLDSPPGCRTNLRARVADAQRMLDGYSAGIHRVVYYGDYVNPIRRMARLMGFKAVQEM